MRRHVVALRATVGAFGPLGRFPFAMQTGFSPRRVDPEQVVRGTRTADKIAKNLSFPRRERTY